MDTVRLKYFCTITEVGSLVKAAEVLNISHSGLSKAIGALEEETKLKLFRPQGRGLEITEEGKWFYQKALDILKIVNEVSNGLKKESSTIRIGLSQMISGSCAGLIAKELHELDQNVTILEADVGEFEKMILNSELDFAIVMSPSPLVGIEYLELGEVRFNSFAREDLLKEANVAELPYAVPATEFPFNPSGYTNRDGWPFDIPRMQRFAVSDFAIGLELLRSGQSAIYMPNFVSVIENERTFSKYRIVKVPGHRNAESKRKLLLAKSKTQIESKEMKKVSRVLRKHCCI